MTTYFYGRNSDVESFDKGSSVETQKQKCQSYAVLKDLTIDVEITEQVSGAIPFRKRTKGFELMEKLKKGREEQQQKRKDDLEKKAERKFFRLEYFFGLLRNP